MSRDEIIALARQKAADTGLRPELVLAIVEQESNFNEFAIRYEPAFMARYVGPAYLRKEFSATEAYARAMSWGLGQVMGQTARERGFKGVYLSELCDPWNNLTVMCGILARNLERSAGDETKALLAYNGGANKDYPGEVLARVAKYADTPSPQGDEE